jgi:hypothetical protein
LENGNLSARASRANLTDELDDVESGAADRDPLLGNEETSGVGDKAGIILVNIPVPAIISARKISLNLHAGYS